jgi:hypothetical protein
MQAVPVLIVGGGPVWPDRVDFAVPSRHTLLARGTSPGDRSSSQGASNQRAHHGNLSTVRRRSRYPRSRASAPIHRSSRLGPHSCRRGDRAPGSQAPHGVGPRVCDAEAIAEAVQRPTMKFVATKTADQLDLQALHRVRERLVSQRQQAERLARIGYGFRAPDNPRERRHGETSRKISRRSPLARRLRAIPAHQSKEGGAWRRVRRSHRLQHVRSVPTADSCTAPKGHASFNQGDLRSSHQSQHAVRANKDA